MTKEEQFWNWFRTFYKALYICIFGHAFKTNSDPF